MTDSRKNLKDSPKKARLQKGDAGYIKTAKQRQSIIVLIWVVVIGAVLIAGYMFTKSRLNAATVLGIVLVLPAAKAVVRLILLLPYTSADPEEYARVKKILPPCALIAADLILTRSEGAATYISMAVICGGNVFAFCPGHKKTLAQIARELTESVKAGGGKASPAVFGDFQAFFMQIQKLSSKEETPSNKDEKIRRDLLSRAV